MDSHLSAYWSHRNVRAVLARKGEVSKNRDEQQCEGLEQRMRGIEMLWLNCVHCINCARAPFPTSNPLMHTDQQELARIHRQQ